MHVCYKVLPKSNSFNIRRAAVEAQRKILANHQTSIPDPIPHVQRDAHQPRDTQLDHVDDAPNMHVGAALTVKESVHVRLHNLPNIPELVRNRVPSSVDKDKYLIVNGTVIRSGNTKVLERIQIWKCNTCRSKFNTRGNISSISEIFPNSKSMIQLLTKLKKDIFQQLISNLLRQV